MGKTQTRSQFHKQSVFYQQTSPMSVINRLLKQQNSWEQLTAQEIQNKPIILPKLQIQRTPFKKYQSCLSQSSARVNTQKNQACSSWLAVIYHPTLFQMVLDYCSCQDDENIMLANKRFYSQIYYKRLRMQHNWQLIMWKTVEISNSIDYDILSHYNQEQSQHSMDLDRTQSLFQPDQDLQCQINKLDRIMKALSTSIPYFQGLNSIVATLLGYFDEQKTFLIAKILVHKCQNVQNDCSKYMELIQDIQNQVKKRIPKVYQILHNQDLSIQYFSMKWILGIFSYDLEREVLFVLYSLVCVYGLPALKWFIVALFLELQQNIEEINSVEDNSKINCFQEYCVADNINSLLKGQLKSLVVENVSKNIVKCTKSLMAEQKFSNSRHISPFSSNGKEGDSQSCERSQFKIPCPSNLWYQCQHSPQSLLLQNKGFQQYSPIFSDRQTGKMDDENNISEYDYDNCHIFDSLFGSSPIKLDTKLAHNITPSDRNLINGIDNANKIVTGKYQI